jgi:hypothetical protein
MDLQNQVTATGDTGVAASNALAATKGEPRVDSVPALGIFIPE